MTASITVGTRFPAHLTAAGRPHSLPDAEIGTRLARADLRAHTSRTLTSPHAPARGTAPGAPPGVRAGRPGTGGRPAVGRRAGQGPGRRGGGPA
ncbi:hypothetical protein [Streptomyces flaveolus]